MKARTTVTFVLEQPVEPEWLEEFESEKEAIAKSQKEIEKGVQEMLSLYHPTSVDVIVELI